MIDARPGLRIRQAQNGYILQEPDKFASGQRGNEYVFPTLQDLYQWLKVNYKLGEGKAE